MSNIEIEDEVLENRKGSFINLLAVVWDGEASHRVRVARMLPEELFLSEPVEKQILLG